MIWGLKTDYTLLNLSKKASFSQWEFKSLFKTWRQHCHTMLTARKNNTYSHALFLFFYFHLFTLSPTCMYVTTPLHVEITLYCHLSLSQFIILFRQKNHSFSLFISSALAQHYFLAFILGAFFFSHSLWILSQGPVDCYNDSCFVLKPWNLESVMLPQMLL